MQLSIEGTIVHDLITRAFFTCLELQMEHSVNWDSHAQF
uniref:Uncharacterized protein n=1 Tax=Setaria italica TaxID=4555 RepID=K3Y4J2_SETIT